MLAIRGLILDGVALLGVGAGLLAGIGGYLHNLPEPSDHVALAAAWADPDTTGAIAAKDAAAAPEERAPPVDAAAKPSRADATAPQDPGQGPWTDPPRHGRRR